MTPATPPFDQQRYWLSLMVVGCRPDVWVELDGLAGFVDYLDHNPMTAAEIAAAGAAGAGAGLWELDGARVRLTAETRAVVEALPGGAPGRDARVVEEWLRGRGV